MEKPSRQAEEMDRANAKLKKLNTPVCGNCSSYVVIQVLQPRSKKVVMVCRLNGLPMNPNLIAGCPYYVKKEVLPG